MTEFGFLFNRCWLPNVRREPESNAFAAAPQAAVAGAWPGERWEQETNAFAALPQSGVTGTWPGVRRESGSDAFAAVLQGGVAEGEFRRAVRRMFFDARTFEGAGLSPASV